ncbi:recombinase family protein [Serpentinicella sp. ANB-PHB4]|uniref:recombinase family protein n=1 Tax=Serpentinicella sp. ANB-PHB4 TaxID=3074076 RepID=UPI0028612695|nr:recombinase family protein [Serpentinicella sp. ANB-PHB4]MDR5659880.1 recombinase family protein [Serpentinicella sp. ANB-PHB4]
MKIAIYSRKSKFTGKGESIENQVQMCKDHVNPIYDNIEFFIYEDEGFSGGNLDRPKFKQMMKDAANKKFETIVCYRLDRISRNIADFTNLIENLDKYNVSFISIKEKFDTSTSMGRAMMYISSVFAQLERETIGERIRDNMLKLARTGRWLGGKAPTGYKGETISYVDGSGNTRKATKLVIVPEEATLMKNVFQKYLELGSLSRLETWCLQNNIKSRNGLDIKKTTLKRMLENATYVKADENLYNYFKKLQVDIASQKSEFNGVNGILLSNKHNIKSKKYHKIREKEEWIIAVGQHEGIINSIDWIKAQDLLNSNKGKGPKYQAGSIGLITPLLKCQCGSNMRISIKYYKGLPRWYYYKCILKEASKGSRCSSKNINGTEADSLVVNEIKKMEINKGILSDQLKKKFVKPIQVDANSIKKEIEKYTKSINRLTDQIAEGSTATKYLIQKIEEFDIKIKALEKELTRSEMADEKNQQVLDQINITKNMISQFNTHYDEMDIFQRRNLLKSFIKEIEYDGEDLLIKVR